MAPRLSSIIITITLATTSVAAAAVSPARADSAGEPEAYLPGLVAFSSQIANGKADQLRGVYVVNLFADQVMQQPSGEPGFVSPAPDVLTQFSGAAQFGSTGLLAHNYLAGTEFAQIQLGQTVYLVYGDGHTRAYLVTQRLTYRALQPDSAYSSFVDLSSGEKLSAFVLFDSIYDRPGSVILQTCIEANGSPTWGRLFVIAEPDLSPRIWQRNCRRCK